MSINSFLNTVGVRFHPTDEEIINHFLNNKMNGRNSIVDHVIGEINLLQFHPQDIPAFSKIPTDDDDDEQCWYFFNRPDYKDSNSKRTSRKTKRGFWKPTGKIRPIKVRGEEIGSKKTLVYYERGCGLKPTKTNWIIHEFQAKTTLPHQSNFVVCKLKYKADEKWIPSGPNPMNSDAENHETQSQMQLKHSRCSDDLLLTTSSSNQQTLSNIDDTCEDDERVWTGLADSFLDLDEFPYEDQYAETLPND